MNKPLVSANHGKKTVDDIVEAVNKRLPKYLHGLAKYSDDEFKKLKRDADGNIIGINFKGFENRMTPEQIASLTQKDKDGLRGALKIKLKTV